MATLILHQVHDNGTGWKEYQLCIEWPCYGFAYGELMHKEDGCPARSWIQANHGEVWRVSESIEAIQIETARLNGS